LTSGNDVVAGTRSLQQLIADGDGDAIAGFHDSRIEKVRRFCELLCPPGLVESACAATFADFVGRVRTAAPDAVELDEVLLRAARSAAANRLELKRPERRGGRDSGGTCADAAILLAAEQNGELKRPNRGLQRHVKRCWVCRLTAVRMSEAERVFHGSTGFA
jgi:hypothetical protein